METDLSGNNGPRMLWTQTGSFSLESPWMAVQRFMFLNDLSGKDYRYLMKSMSPSPHLSHASLHSGVPWERTAGWDHPSIRHFRRDLQASAALVDFPNKNQLISSKRAIRYCAPCLQRCFHWAFFQLPVVRFCPLHGQELSSTCQVCGSLLGTEELQADLCKRPLFCPVCQTPFVPEMLALRVADGFPEAQDTFRRATQQLNRMAAVTIEALHDYCELDVRSHAAAKLLTNCICRTAFTGECMPVWLFDFDFTERGPDSASQHGARAGVVSRQDQEDGTSVEERLAALSRVYRSVGHYLAKQVRRICGHRDRRRLEFSYECIPFVGNEYHLLMPGDACPCCAVFDWWHARLAYHFGFLQYFQNQTYLKSRAFALYEPWLRHNLPVDANEAAFNALSIFTSLCIRTLGLLGSTREDAVLLLDLFQAASVRDLGSAQAMNMGWWQRQFGEGYLRFYIPRHHVQRESIITRCDDTKVTFGFSLSGALSALEQCHAMRRAGPLWCSSSLSGRLFVGRQERSPRWYEDLAQHANRREWQWAVLAPWQRCGGVPGEGEKPAS